MQHSQADPQPGINALLIGEKTVPSGCRVVNVSGQGMLLHCDPDGRPRTFKDGDAVDIHLTVQHDDGQKKLTIPSIVRHAAEHSIDVEFKNPDPVLLDLIESYRVSEAHHLEAVVGTSSDTHSGPDVIPLPGEQNPHAVAYTGGTRQAETDSGHTSLYKSVAAALAIAGLAIGAYLVTDHLGQRIDSQGVRIDAHAIEIDDLKDGQFNASLLEGRYASLNARLGALSTAFTDLEQRLQAGSDGQAPVLAGDATPSSEPAASVTPPVEPVTAEASDGEVQPQVAVMADTGPINRAVLAASTASDVIDASDAPAAAPASAAIRRAESQAVITPATAPTTPVEETATGPVIAAASVSATPAAETPPPAATPSATASTGTDFGQGDGPWMINVMSTSDKGIAEDFARKAATAGIDYELNSAEVNGSTYWRLQIPGYASLDAAKANADAITAALGTHNAWFLKRK